MPKGVEAIAVGRWPTPEAQAAELHTKQGDPPTIQGKRQQRNEAPGQVPALYTYEIKSKNFIKL